MKKSHIFVKLLLAFVGLNIVLIGTTLSFNPSVKEAFALATTVKPETFTELYFEDHLTLPAKVVLKKEYSFKFTIHNLENKDMEYPYEVYADLEGEKVFIDKKVIFIKNNESKTIEEKFLVSDSFTKMKIVTNLTEKKSTNSFLD